MGLWGGMRLSGWFVFKLQYQSWMQQSWVPSYCLVYCDQSCMEVALSVQLSVSLLCSVLTLLISAYQIYMHLQNFNNPFFQSKIIVILIMPPFYCLTSIASFLFPSLEVYLTFTRDSYEALLLFTFFYLMFSFLAYDRHRDIMQDKKVYTMMVAQQQEVHHFWPFGYCQKPYVLTHWKKAKYFTYRCKKWVMQFVVVKIGTTLLMYFIYPNQHDTQQEGYIPKEHSLQIAISSAVNWVVAISASYSLYYLVLFYHALSRPLAPYSALLKFLTIKITIFFTFWQKVMISLFQDQLISCFDQQAHAFHRSDILSCLENTLICLEMLMMAIAGGYAYDYSNYVSRRGTRKGSLWMVVSDIMRAFKEDFRLIKPKPFGFTGNTHEQDETELNEIVMLGRPSVTCDIKVKQRPVACIVEDYL